MKTKVEFEIPKKDLDAAVKKEMQRLNKEINSLKSKLENRDKKIRELKEQNLKLQEPMKKASEFLYKVEELTGFLMEFKKERECDDCEYKWNNNY